jgi:MYXO-CTERM domain-containing protein
VQEDYLSLSITFTDTPGNLSLGADTIASLHEKSELIETIDGINRATGRARISVGRQELVYQVRVDGGLWRVPLKPQADGTIVVEDAKLKMPGHHVVEVRARYPHDYQSLDPSPASLEATVDPIAPRLSAEIGDVAVLARINDTLTRDPSTLRLFARTDDEWTQIPVHAAEESAIAAIDFSDLGEAGAIELKAQDATGNESGIVRLRLGLSSAEETGGAGCSCSATQAGPGLPFGLLLGLLLIRRRK